MGLNENFIKIEKKFAWSFFGFLLAVILGAFSIYTVYFKDTNPKLDFIVETNTKVLDLRENVRKLDIIYKGENIKESGKNLSIIKIRVQNSSSVNILSGFYDLKDELGFKLENAEIVEKPELTESSNNYIKHNLSFTIDSLGNLKFSPIIIDGGEFFVLKILALNKKNETPTLKPFGKITGIKEFPVIEEYKTNISKPFWKELLEGTFLIHLVRFFAYLILIILVVFIIVIPIILISESISEKKKKSNIKRYKRIKNLSESVERSLVYDLYISYNLDGLVEFQQLVSNERLLKIKLRSFIRREQKVRPGNDGFNKEDVESLTFTDLRNKNIIIENGYDNLYRNKFIAKLYEANIIGMKDNQLSLNASFVEELNNLISYLKLL